MDNSEVVLASTRNGASFDTLPAELILQIISHIPAAPFPFLTDDLCTEVHISRSATLHSLSQTCKWIRTVILPLIWQSLEVCHVPIPPNWEDGSTTFSRRSGIAEFDRWQKHISEELLRQLGIVTVHNPSFAVQVQSITVLFSEYAARPVQAQFARYLSRLPNLHSVQVLWTRRRSGADYIDFQECFETVRCMSVRNLAMHYNASYMAPCFPQVRHLTLTTLREPRLVPRNHHHIGLWTKHCAEIESLRAYHGTVTDDGLFGYPQVVCSSYPYLREYPFQFSLRLPEWLLVRYLREDLASMKQLHTLNFRLRKDEKYSDGMRNVLDTALEVLRLMPPRNGSKKQVKVWRINENDETVDVDVMAVE